MTKTPISRETQTPEVSSTQLMRTIPQLRLRSLKSKGLKRAVGIHLCKNQKVKRIFWRVRKMVFRRSRVGNLPALLPQKKWEEKSLDLEQVLCGYLVLCITPGSPFLLPQKEVGSKESGSRARASVVRVFGFMCNPRFPPLFVTAKRSVKQRVWI